MIATTFGWLFIHHCRTVLYSLAEYRLLNPLLELAVRLMPSTGDNVKPVDYIREVFTSSATEKAFGADVCNELISQLSKFKGDWDTVGYSTFSFCGI